jgi:hypothetical protein
LPAKSVGDSGEAQFALPDEKKRFFNQNFILSRFRCCWQWNFVGFLAQLIIDLVFFLGSGVFEGFLLVREFLTDFVASGLLA